MSNRYDLVVFDWEGTIADTVGDIFQVVAQEANALGFGEFSAEHARQYVDLGLARAMQKVFPNLTLIEQENLLHAVQVAMHTRGTEVCLFPGVRELIIQLHEAHINVAVATNKGHQSLMRAIQSAGLDSYIKVTRSAGQVPAKPCPQMLEEIIAEFSGSTSTTLMIGDAMSDIEMANQLNVAAIAVDFYHQQSLALKEAGALAVFDNYQQVANFLNLTEQR